jgi:cytosine/uracil/thiamine/allantoin permease
MLRVVLEEIALFLVPFGLFAIFLLLRRRNLLRFEHWSSSMVWLTIAGLLLALASLVGSVFFTERPLSGFEPTHMENGRVVPGRFR